MYMYSVTRKVLECLVHVHVAITPTVYGSSLLTTLVADSAILIT